jgi:integrase
VPPEVNKSESKEGEQHARRVPLVGQAQEIVQRYLLRPADKFCFDPAQAVEERNAARRDGKHLGKDGKHWPSYQRRIDAIKGRRCAERYTKDTYRAAIRYAIRAVNRTILNQIKDEMPDASREQIQEAFTRQRIPDWHPHQLRHTAATLVRKALGDSGLDAARALLGQKTLAIADVYAEVDQELAVKAAKHLAI